MSVSEIQKARLRFTIWAKKHKDNPAITQRVRVISKNLGMLAAKPDNAPLLVQTAANVADLAAAAHRMGEAVGGVQ